ncbi:MAG: UDP-N-acetylmuramoyl-L-alanyl-D-glutamate--2,6-diaminopimelate ligase [Chthoniobacterales bacterium]
MKLDQLITQTNILSISGAILDLSKVEITDLCYDSRQALSGSLFFALPGAHARGASFAQDATARGAVAVVAQEQISELSVPVILVSDARIAMAELAASFYEHPSFSLALCGITGTNGKTTTSYLVRHLCEANGRACGLIGTVGYVLPGMSMEAPRTTPESTDLQKMMQTMRDGGFKALAMEASSHAIIQERVRAIEFDVAIFTNLTQDHLDYHGSMEAYFNAKKLLFENLAKQTKKRGRAIINSDDRYGRILLDRLPVGLSRLTFGQSSNADFRASDIRYSGTGTTFRLDARGRSYLVRSPLIGLFNVYNVLGALASATSMGLELRRAIKALATAPQVPGRLQRVSDQTNFQIFVDYAHTPDALENVLRSLRQLQPSRLIVVFGCGGDRDRAKRPMMAAAAEMYADEIIITSDNPRSENPDAIIREAMRGFQKKNHQGIVDREAAIYKAIESAAPNDIVLIAGKGHEAYQEINGVCLPFNDVLVAKRAIREVMQKNN